MMGNLFKITNRWGPIFLMAGLFYVQVAKAFSSATRNSFIGFDLGTSGARISIVERNEEGNEINEIYTDSMLWGEGSYDDEKVWMEAVEKLLCGASDTMGMNSLRNVRSLCVSGTSASCLIIDSNNAGETTRRPRMYNYDVSNDDGNTKIYSMKALELLDRHAPPRHTARAKTGSLAKLLTWNEEKKLQPGEVLCHQADYITMKLMSDAKQCGSGQLKRLVRSDWHNCLKLGYDVQKLQWPDWIEACLIEAGISDPINAGVVPKVVVSPGEKLGTISSYIAKKFGLPEDTVVVGGTTDSNAAFFAAVGGTRPSLGTAVTSLGSTLAIKQLSQTYVEDAERGVYSHRFPTFSSEKDEGDREEEAGEAWLIGGASNVGCAVLRQLNFSNEELRLLSEEIQPQSDSPLSYYPLTKKGERFPVADGDKEPILEPVPPNRRDYLHAILQGISDVEREGFLTLGSLGASPDHPGIVLTCGGGSKNDMWNIMRERRLSSAFDGDKVKVRRAKNTEASFGAAILAAASFD